MNTLEEWRAVALASLGLPDDKLLGVLALVEQVPDRGQVREVLEKMRPRLVQLRPPRPITVQRLLFRPVEDLFDPPERYRAKIGRLSRHTTSPCWAIVHAHLEKSLVQRVGNALKKIDSTNHQDLYSVGLPFWQASGAVLSAFLAADDSIGRHRVGSGQVTITEDLRQQLLDIADILDIAGEIEAVKMRLPERPIAGVSQVDAEMLGEVITRLGAQSTRRVQTFVLVILARMTRPGDLLKVFSEVSLPCTTIERTGLLKHVGSNALSGLANEAHDLRNRRDASRDPTAGTVEAEQLVSRLVSLERSLGSLHDRGVKEKVLAARKEIGSYVIDKLVVSADQNLFENLNSVRGELDAAGVPEPTVEQMEQAERSALLLRRCARIAESTGVRKEMDKKLTTICSELEREGVSLGPNRQVHEGRLIRSVRLIELIAGPDEAERVLMSQFGIGKGPAS